MCSEVNLFLKKKIKLILKYFFIFIEIKYKPYSEFLLKLWLWKSSKSTKFNPFVKNHIKQISTHLFF